MPPLCRCGPHLIDLTLKTTSVTLKRDNGVFRRFVSEVESAARKAMGS